MSTKKLNGNTVELVQKKQVGFLKHMMLHRNYQHRVLFLPKTLKKKFG